MYVVIVDATSGRANRQLAETVEEHLSRDATFTRIIHLEWPMQGSESGPTATPVLVDHFKHSDAVVTLPVGGRDPREAIGPAWLARTAQLCDAVAEAAVGTLIYGSSALGYSPSLTREPVDEGWAMQGIPGYPLSQAIADADRFVGDFEREHTVIRVVRLRPALVLDAGSTAMTPPGRRWWFRRRQRRRLGIGLEAVQAIGPSELAEAYRRALRASVSGPINVASGFVTPRAAGEPRPGPTISPEWWRLARSGPVIETGRARRDLGAAPPPVTASEEPTPAPPPQRPRFAPAYLAALEYFDKCVAGIGEAEWGLAAWPRTSVRQLVALAAQDQYRLALLLEGRDDQEVERELPGDPLGVEPADGWALAAERGRLALEAGPHPGSPDPDELVFEEAANLVVRGWYLARAVDGPSSLDPELLGFLREAAASSGVLEAGTAAATPTDELLAAIATVRPPIHRWRVGTSGDAQPDSGA